ncbi:hypothetical protein FDQ90_01025 [Escherichia coli]|nr:hypothetical protein [Escherichia coli]
MSFLICTPQCSGDTEGTRRPANEWFLHELGRKIGNGWKSFNTHTIESTPANRDTSLHTTYRSSLYDL